MFGKHTALEEQVSVSIFVFLSFTVSFRFGSGYTLQVKVQPMSSDSEGLKNFSSRVSFRRSQSREVASPIHSSVSISYRDTHNVEQFINKTFPGSVLLEHHQVAIRILSQYY